MSDQKELVENYASALGERDPYGLARSLQASLNLYRTWAAEEKWSLFRPLADAIDDLLAAGEPALADDEILARLITLSRQVCVILALMGDANGRRDNGFFRASLAHASRLDAMTDNKLQLVELVNLIQA